jgi:hypothetical protein
VIFVHWFVFVPQEHVHAAVFIKHVQNCTVLDMLKAADTHVATVLLANRRENFIQQPITTIPVIV